MDIVSLMVSACSVGLHAGRVNEPGGLRWDDDVDAKAAREKMLQRRKSIARRAGTAGGAAANPRASRVSLVSGGLAAPSPRRSRASMTAGVPAFVPVGTSPTADNEAADAAGAASGQLSPTRRVSSASRGVQARRFSTSNGVGVVPSDVHHDRQGGTTADKVAAAPSPGLQPLLRRQSSAAAAGNQIRAGIRRISSAVVKTGGLPAGAADRIAQQSDEGDGRRVPPVSVTPMPAPPRIRTSAAPSAPAHRRRLSVPALSTQSGTTAHAPSGRHSVSPQAAPQAAAGSVVSGRARASTAALGARSGRESESGMAPFRASPRKPPAPSERSSNLAPARHTAFPPALPTTTAPSSSPAGTSPVDQLPPSRSPRRSSFSAGVGRVSQQQLGVFSEAAAESADRDAEAAHAAVVSDAHSLLGMRIAAFLMIYAGLFILAWFIFVCVAHPLPSLPPPPIRAPASASCRRYG